MKNNGFLYVASLNKKYLTAAKYSASSLRDYWPDANITLFTHPEWVKESDNILFNNIITENVPNHKRAKLWALNKTPYNLTCYIDVDTWIEHDDIKNIFKQHKKSSDITITKARSYAASINSKFKPGHELTDHCGLFIYNNKKKTLNFMDKWWELYLRQESKEWRWPKDYPEYLRPWDMWTYWWLQNMTEHKIKRSYFSKPDARWNFIHVYKNEELMGTEPVIIHRPIPK